MNTAPLFARRRIQQQSGVLHQSVAPYTAPLTVNQLTTSTAQGQAYPHTQSGSLPGPIPDFGIPATISGWLGRTPSPSGDIPPAGDVGPIVATGATYFGQATFIQGHHYLAGIQVAPYIPENMIAPTIGQLPGFDDIQVHAIVGDQAGPFAIPAGTQSLNANYAVSLHRSGPDVQNQPLPPNVLWVTDIGQMALPGAPVPAGQPLTPGAAAISKGPFGLEPMAFVLLALAGIVGVVLVTSAGTKPHRATNPSRRRRIRR